jgi:hypothetical protein
LTSITDIANQALSLIGTRSEIVSLSEQSNEAISATKWIDTCRRRVLRMAPWNSVKNFNNLALICAAPGTPENPSAGTTMWQKGLPPPPWSYEYAYPSDCVRPIFIVPQFSTGFGPGIPITTAVTGGAPNFWNGPPIKFAVGIDQVLNGIPAVGGPDVKVIWTNQEFALLAYLKDVDNPDVMDDLLQGAWSTFLASRMVIDLTGDKGLANMLVKDANDTIQIARTADGNEGLTINDVTPDWIRTRGVDYAWDFAWSPGWGDFSWGGLLPSFG